MPKVTLIEDEDWPVWKLFHDEGWNPRDRFEVPAAQLRYWEAVIAEYRRVQRQMATVACAAVEHEKYADTGPCLTCNPPKQPLDAA